MTRKIIQKTNESRRIIAIDTFILWLGATASAVPREGTNDLYEKIIKYVYEIRMIELD